MSFAQGPLCAGAAQAGHTTVMVPNFLPSGKVTPSLGWAVATATVFTYNHLKTPLQFGVPLIFNKFSLKTKSVMPAYPFLPPPLKYVHLFIWLHGVWDLRCSMLDLVPGPGPPALGVQSPSH